jgi:hypothetical protein
MIGIWYGLSVMWEPRVNLDCISYCKKKSEVVSFPGAPGICSLHQEIGLQRKYVPALCATPLLVSVHSG